MGFCSFFQFGRSNEVFKLCDTFLLTYLNTRDEVFTEVLHTDQQLAKKSLSSEMWSWENLMKSICTVPSMSCYASQLSLLFSSSHAHKHITLQSKTSSSHFWTNLCMQLWVVGDTFLLFSLELLLFRKESYPIYSLKWRVNIQWGLTQSESKRSLKEGNPSPDLQCRAAQSTTLSTQQVIVTSGALSLVLTPIPVWLCVNVNLLICKVKIMLLQQSTQCSRIKWIKFIKCFLHQTKYI